MCWWIGGPEAAMDTLAWELIIKPRVFNQPGNDPGITAPAILKFDTSRYANIGAWQERLTAKPYWSTA
jgi:hypothetical protein